MSNLGRYVKGRREQRGWTRAELARVSGVPYSTLTNWELNLKEVKASEENINKIAAVLEEGGDNAQLRILAGYDVLRSVDVSERAKRIDALLTVQPRWGAALEAVERMTPEEADQALTGLEVHVELVKRRRRRR